MKLELIKLTKSNGEVWWNVYLDGIFKNCFLDEPRARKFYDEIKINKRVEEKSETLLSEEI